MKILKLLIAGAAVGIVLSAFRDSERETWIVPARPWADDGEDEDDLTEEPILGYDGMDVDTFLEWLESADLDRETLVRIREYEEGNFARGTILDAIDDRL